MGHAPALDFLNPQQRRAVECRDVSVVLSSGAGCGKTHVLTERYLSYLESDEAEPSQVVAITFTDRAARQMRERIRQALGKKLQQAASDAEAGPWARHLRGLETAPINTIHAFCANFLRQHAVEAGLDPHFSVLEDVLSANLEEEARSRTLQGLLTSDTPSGENLRELVLLYGWKPVVETVQHLVRPGNSPGWENWLQKSVPDIARWWQEFALEILLPKHVQHILHGIPKIASCLDLLTRVRAKAGTKMAANVGIILDKLPLLAEAQDVPAAVKELVDLAKVGSERARAWNSEEEYELMKTALEGFRGEIKDQMGLYQSVQIDLEKAAEVGQRFLRVATEVSKEYQGSKRRHGVVDFQDLLVMSRDLLRDRPGVRERMQRRYRYLLIDELQDTDPLQMEIVEHLCGAGLTQGKLFAVGDHKQSIYRFRNADVLLFRQLRDKIPQEGRLELSINYRSQPAILDFTNALLEKDLQGYEPLHAFHTQVNSGPCIEFLWSPRGSADSVWDARKQEAEWIARRIALMLADAERLITDRENGVGKLRPVKAGDIALLFRAMSNVSIYESALRNQGLDYYLVGGRTFFAQQEIYDLLNLLRTLENPQDSLSLAGTLRSPFCCLSDEALLLLAHHPLGLWAGLHDSETMVALPPDQLGGVQRAQRFLGRWQRIKDRMPIARLLGEVFADSGYDASTQFEFLGDRKLANLWKLVDLARTFDRSGLFGLPDFIQRLAELVRTQPREEQAATQPENADVIRLMTIHQAKGLEFPLVIIPDLSASGRSSSRFVAHWDEHLGCVCRPPDENPLPFPDLSWRLWETAESLEDYHEDLRTLYVGCTRAEDYLILSAALPKPFKPTNSWMLTLAGRFDLQTGTFLDGNIPAAKLPLIQVTETPPPFPKETLRSSKTKAKELFIDNDSWKIAPVPPRIPGGECLPFSFIERPLQSIKTGPIPRDVIFRGSLLSVQYGKEESEEFTTWLDPYEKIQGLDLTNRGMEKQVIRAVLERWDFKDSWGWRPFLNQALGSWPHPELVLGSKHDLERLFIQFAKSEVFRDVAKAVASHRSMEFLVGFENGGIPGGENLQPLPPSIRGVIDCLWQDRGGNWHLLFYDYDKENGNLECTAGMMMLAGAVNMKLGRWPKSLTLYDFQRGRFDRCDQSVFADPQLQAAIARVLSALPGRTLTDY